MKLTVKIEILGNTATLFLVAGKRKVVAEKNWTDERDLSDKLLKNFEKCRCATFRKRSFYERHFKVCFCL